MKPTIRIAGLIFLLCLFALPSFGTTAVVNSLPPSCSGTTEVYVPNPGAGLLPGLYRCNGGSPGTWIFTVPISLADVPAGGGSFASLTGQPTDNSALATALAGFLPLSLGGDTNLATNAHTLNFTGAGTVELSDPGSTLTVAGLINGTGTLQVNSVGDSVEAAFFSESGGGQPFTLEGDLFAKGPTAITDGVAIYGFMGGVGGYNADVTGNIDVFRAGHNGFDTAEGTWEVGSSIRGFHVQDMNSATNALSRAPTSHAILVDDQTQSGGVLHTAIQTGLGPVIFGDTTQAPEYIATAPAPTVAASQVGFGGTTAAVTNCGSLTSSTSCLVINVAGTTRYIPIY